MRGEADEARRPRALEPPARAGRPRRRRPAADPSLRPGRRRPAASSGPSSASARRSKAFKRERFEEARKILRPLAERRRPPSPCASSSGSPTTGSAAGRRPPPSSRPSATSAAPPSSTPCSPTATGRSGRHAKVAELWEELRAASPSAALVAEGRIVSAGSLADQGRLEDAIRAARAPPSRPPSAPRSTTSASPTRWPTCTSGPATCRKARQLFTIVAAADPELGDVTRAERPASLRLLARAVVALRRRCAPASPSRPCGAAARLGAHRPASHPRRRSGAFPLHVRSRTVGGTMSTPSSRPQGPTSPSSSDVLSRDAGAAHRCPRATSVLALELTVRPREGPAESVPVAWLAARRRPRPPGPPARRCSSRAGSAAGSSGPAGATQSRTEVVAAPWSCPPGGRPTAGQGGRGRAGPLAGTVVTARRGSAMMGPTAGTNENERHMNQEQLEKVRRARASSPPSTRAGAARPRPSSSTASARTRTTATTRCSTASTRCAPGSSPAPASPATGCSAPSSSKTTWTGRSRAATRPSTSGRSKGVVPFLKVDKGLADEADGVQVMKPMPGLDRAARAGRRQGRVRHEDALGHQAGRPEGRRRPSSTSSSRSAGRSWPTAWCRSSSPRSTSTARRRPRPRRCSRRRCWRGLDALPADEQVMFKLTLPGRGRLLRRPRRPPEGR